MLLFEFPAVFNRKRNGKAIERIIYRVCNLFSLKNRSKTSANAIEKIIYRLFAPIAIIGNETTSKINEVVGFGRTKTLRLINSLVKKGYLIKFGEGRGTKYMLPK